MELRTGRLLLCIVLVAGVATAPSRADDQKSTREQELLHRAQQQLQQLQQENASLAHDKSDAEQKLKSAADDADAAKRSGRAEQARSAALSGELARSKTAQEQLQAQLDDTSKRLAEMTQKANDTAVALKAREGELGKANAALAQSVAAHQGCEAKNEKLFEYGQTLLQRYQKKGVWEAFKQKEPLTGVGDVEMQNILQEYSDKLAAQRIQKP